MLAIFSHFGRFGLYGISLPFPSILIHFHPFPTIFNHFWAILAVFGLFFLLPFFVTFWDFSRFNLCQICLTAATVDVRALCTFLMLDFPLKMSHFSSLCKSFSSLFSRATTLTVIGSLFCYILIIFELFFICHFLLHFGIFN